MTTRRARLRCQRGSVLVAGLLLSIALLMLLGAAVDIGHAFIVRRDLTAQADDAAPPIQMVAQRYEAFVPFAQHSSDAINAIFLRLGLVIFPAIDRGK